MGLGRRRRRRHDVSVSSESKGILRLQGMAQGVLNWFVAPCRARLSARPPLSSCNAHCCGVGALVRRWGGWVLKISLLLPNLAMSCLEESEVKRCSRDLGTSAVFVYRWRNDVALSQLLVGGGVPRVRCREVRSSHCLLVITWMCPPF